MRVWADDAAAAEAELFALMTKKRMTTAESFDATAEITRSAGKTQNIVKPEALYALLEEQDFFHCVSVSVTKAKEFLGKKELDGITKSIPGTPGEPTLKVTLKK